MRLKIKFTKNTKKVPHDLQNFNSYIHRLLGANNPYHDGPSDYSCTGMLGGELVDGGRNLNFPNGGYIIFSTKSSTILDLIVSNMIKEREYGYGMSISGYDFISEKLFSGDNLMMTIGKGYLLKGNTKLGEPKFLTPDNTENFHEKIKEQIVNKFRKINPKLNFNSFDIEPLRRYRVQNVYVKGIKNITSTFTLSIKADEETMEYLYHYGIGHSTGSGFGSICCHDNHQKIYPELWKQKREEYETVG